MFAVVGAVAVVGVGAGAVGGAVAVVGAVVGAVAVVGVGARGVEMNAAIMLQRDDRIYG